MERVLIIGSNGAGKSTFSYALADKTGLPLVHLDKLYWRGNWKVTPEKKFYQLVLREAQKPRWIIEGNNLCTLGDRLDYADTVFWFEFPPWLCLFRILKREWTYRGRVRPDMPDQCVSKLELSFLKSAWNFNYDKHDLIKLFLEVHASVQVIHFTSPRQAKRYLASLDGK